MFIDDYWWTVATFDTTTKYNQEYSYQPERYDSEYDQEDTKASKASTAYPRFRNSNRNYQNNSPRYNQKFDQEEIKYGSEIITRPSKYEWRQIKRNNQLEKYNSEYDHEACPRFRLLVEAYSQIVYIPDCFIE